LSSSFLSHNIRDKEKKYDNINPRPVVPQSIIVIQCNSTAVPVAGIDGAQILPPAAPSNLFFAISNQQNNVIWSSVSGLGWDGSP
jgi:hypothetical protein